MGVFISIIFGAAIAYYVYSILRKSSRSVKEGKCVSCSGKCSSTVCSVNLEPKK